MTKQTKRNEAELRLTERQSSDKEWFSAAQLAGLPGMPGSDRGVERRAQKEGWSRRRRSGRGGGFEFYVSALPTDTRNALNVPDAEALVPDTEAAKTGKLESTKLKLREDLTSQMAHNRQLESLKQSISLPERSACRLDAKLAMLRACEAFRQTHGLSLTDAEHQFTARYNRGEIELPAFVRELFPDCSERTLRRWRASLKTEGIARLAGKYGNRQGKGKIDTQPQLRDFVIGFLVDTPHARIAHVMRALKARFGNTTAVLPSKRSLGRWINQWKSENAQTFMSIANPDEWKNRYMVSYGSASEGIARLNQRWELDSTPADVMLTDGRHSIIGVLDVYTRRGKLLVTKTSKATAIATLVRHALLDWGVPEEAKTDNGQDYTSNHIKRVFASLDIEHTLCPPFQPWHKPHIERFFGTFTRDLVELLRGYIGHSVAERKAIESRRSFADRLMSRGEVVEVNMSAADFQKFCDSWCEDIYLHRGHEGLGGKTPFEVLAAWREPVRRIEDERALDILLAEAPARNGMCSAMRISQKAGLRVDNGTYFAPELEAYIGQQVQVRFDPQDMGHVFVFGGPDMQFVCIAGDPERTGINRQEVAVHAKEIQKHRVQEERRALKAIARSVKTRNVVDEIFRHYQEENSKLSLFPKPIELHQSDGLKAAADAAAARLALFQPPCPREPTDEERAIQERMIAAQHQPLRANPRDTEEGRYAFACMIERRLQTGLPVEENYREWLPSYQTTAEYRARKHFHEHFGLTPDVDAVRVWESEFERAYYLTEQSMLRELTADESEFLTAYRKENPESAQGIDGLIEAARAGANRITASAG